MVVCFVCSKCTELQQLIDVCCVARKVDALDQWCLRWILDIHWYHRVSNCEVRRLTEQPPLTSIIQKRRLTLFGHLVTLKNDLARHNLTLEDAIELALNKPLWRLLAASVATH